MTITEPNNTYPLPVENPICYGLLESKYLLDIGRINFAEFVFLSSAPNVDGEEIIIMGQTFTVDSSSGSTSSSWNGGSNSGIINAQFFQAMMEKSFYFTDYIVELDTTGANPRVLLKSKGNTDIPGWDDIDDTGLTNAIVGSVINGQAPQYVNGFRIMYRPEYFDGTNWCPVCDAWNLAPVPVGSDYNPLRLDVDIHGALSKLVKTRLPKLSQTVTELDQTATKQVRMKVGGQKIGDTGQTLYDEFTTSDEIVIINSALQPDGPSDFAQYVYRLDTPARFLTSRALVSKVSKGANMWFWLYGNLEEVYTNDGETVTAVEYTLETKFYNANGLLSISETVIANNDGLLIIPVGPKNSIHPATTEPTATHTEVTVMGVATLDGSGDTRDLSISETYALHFDRVCDGIDLYFLSPYGGYDTLSFTKKIAIDINSSMTEICIDDPCGGDLVSAGKSQIGGVSFERIVLETNEYQRNEDVRRFLRDFKISESRFVLTQNEAGTEILRRFLVEPGTLRVWQDGEKLRLSVAGIYGNELRQQSQG